MNESFEDQKARAEQTMRAMARHHTAEDRVPPGYGGMAAPAADSRAGESTDASLRPTRRTFAEDDLLLVAVFFLLFNEDKEDDFLALLLLAVLFFS